MERLSPLAQNALSLILADRTKATLNAYQALKELDPDANPETVAERIKDFLIMSKRELTAEILTIMQHG